MKESFMELLSEAFADIGSLNSEKAMKLTEGAMTLLKDLKDRLESGDPDASEQARKEALQIQQWLSSQMEGLSEKTGISAEEFSLLSQNPDFDALEEMRKQEERMAPSEYIHRKRKLKTRLS